MSRMNLYARLSLKIWLDQHVQLPNVKTGLISNKAANVPEMNDNGMRTCHARIRVRNT